MLTRFIRNKGLKTCRFAFSTQQQTPQKIEPPELKSFEFEPFKFSHEREELMYGYTMEELFGRRYGFKHSEGQHREMRKDSVLFFVLTFLGFYSIFRSRDEHLQLQKAWDNYIAHDLTQVRPIPDHIKN